MQAPCGPRHLAAPSVVLSCKSPDMNCAALQEDSKKGDPDEMEELKPTALSFWVSSLFQNSLLEQQVTWHAELL